MKIKITNEESTTPSLFQQQMQFQERMMTVFQDLTNQINVNMRQQPPPANPAGKSKKAYTIEEVNAVVKYWTKPNCPFKYCWSHGSNRTHDSNGCTRQATGHKTDATFDNRKGGRVWNIVKHSKKDFS